jgi:hypothetical protein
MREHTGVLTFRVSNTNLSGAIEILHALGGFARHPEVYQTLLFERSRRALQPPPCEIRLTRGAFEALPHVIRRLLTAEHGRADAAAARPV